MKFFITLCSLTFICQVFALNLTLPKKPLVESIETYKSEGAYWFRNDNPKGQYKRVDLFDCSDSANSFSLIRGVEKYEKRVAEFKANLKNKTPDPEFTNLKMTSVDYDRINKLIPDTWDSLVKLSEEPHLGANSGGLLLSIFYRETQGDLFLDEKTTSPHYLRPGAGLLQMTAVREYLPNGDYVPWHFDNFVDYKNYYHTTPPLDGRIPSEVSMIYKNKVFTYNDFITSAYNPVASLWFGRKDIIEGKMVQLASAQFTSEGFDIKKTAALGNSNASAIVGVTYNAGCHRVRCAVRRINIWNKHQDTEKMDLHAWENLRSMLYLDQKQALKMGLPPSLVSDLKNACQGVTDACSSHGGENCSCLDNEVDPDEERRKVPTILEGYTFKAAVSTSYGDHIKKIVSCP